MSAAVSPGWYQDPTGQGDARYWNGASWTESVNRGGIVLNAGVDPSQPGQRQTRIGSDQPSL